MTDDFKNYLMKNGLLEVEIATYSAYSVFGFLCKCMELDRGSKGGGQREGGNELSLYYLWLLSKCIRLGRGSEEGGWRGVEEMN